MHNIEIPHKNKSVSLFHINACSLKSLKSYLNLNNYSFEFTATGTLM